ncbi:hypothetical protein ILYODFUR_034843 [Ilyodon furcidens]|uniref:Uncharacterized protein n=1 Tax=Ilyodon furcidens TaxID=33524 RepID=A0ABV0ST27_9TELE
MCSFAGYLPEPDFAFSIVCCFGFFRLLEKDLQLCGLRSKLPAYFVCQQLASSFLTGFDHKPPEANPVHPPSLQNHHQNLSAKQLESSTHRLRSLLCSTSLSLHPSWQITPHSYWPPGSGFSRTTSFPKVYMHL